MYVRLPFPNPMGGENEERMQRYFGKRYSELSIWLSKTWLKEGKPVCIIEGFPGVGKTSLSGGLLHLPGWKVVKIDIPDAEFIQANTLLLDLAQEFWLKGFHEMAEAVDRGPTALSFALEGLLRKPVLIIFDNFQHAFVEGFG